MLLDKLPKWLQSIFTNNTWVLQIFIVILMTAIIHYIEVVIYKRLKPTLEKTKTRWDIAVLQAIHKPLGALIWLLGISFSIQIIHAVGKGIIFSAIIPLRELAVIAIIVWFLLRFIKEVEKILIKPDVNNKAYDKTSINAVSQILRATIMVTAVLVALQTFGYNISGVLALGGVGGIILGFAAKDVLANFFGGLMIYFDRPFNVGDWIRSPDRSIEGTVEHIGWRLCRIRTFDLRPLYVPNALFSTISVENPSRMLNRRIYTNIGVRYGDAPKLRAIIGDVTKMLRNHPEIDNKQTLLVNLIEFGPSSLNFMVYTFTKTTNWVKYQDIQQDVFLKIIDIITARGAQCAFPTTTLHVPEGVEIKNFFNKSL